MIEKDLLSITVFLYINITKYRLKRERDANFNSFIENYSWLLFFENEHHFEFIRFDDEMMQFNTMIYRSID